MKQIFYTIFLTAALSLSSATVFAQPANNMQGAMEDTQIRLMSGDNLDRSAVLSLQKQLNMRGYNPGRIDGIWGPKTLNALNRYEQDSTGSTTPDGLVNIATLNTLGIQLKNAISADGTDGPMTINPAAGAN